MSDIPSFLDYLFGQRAGWACLGWLDGDPRLGELDAKHQEWFELPQNRETMERRAAWHSDHGHNLYVRQVLFSKKSGYQTNALPSPILWQDEATIDTPASMLIETSPGNYQAFSRLDRLADTAERKAMMTAWRDSRPGTDNCSKDPVHFVRVPGGTNRKGAGGNGTWRVRYAMQSERTYTADRLLARCGAQDGGDTPHLSAARGSHSKADDWRGLVDGELLYTSKRWQLAILHRPQLNQLLNLRQPVIITNKNGRTDDSDSAQRAVFVQNIITACPKKCIEHFPEQEIRAVAHYLKPMLGSGKTEREYQADIDWMIGLYRPKNYNPKPTRYIGAARDVIKKPVGRPTHAPEVKRFYLFLQERIVNDAPVSRAALGGEYGVHTRTVATYLEELKDAGKIAWERKSRGLVITFGPSDVIEIQPAVAPELPIAAPEIEQSAPVHEETEIRGVCVSSDRADADHISQAAHSDESPTLAELARAYLSLPAPRVENALVDRETGEIKTHSKPDKPAYRRTAKHFAGWVAEYGYAADESRAAYEAERQYLAELTRREWARLFKVFKAMADDELIAFISTGRLNDTVDLDYAHVIRDKHYYKTRLDCARRALAWRGLKMPAKPTKAKPVTPAKSRQQAAQRPTAPALVQPDLFSNAPAQNPYRIAALDLADRLRARQQVQL